MKSKESIISQRMALVEMDIVDVLGKSKADHSTMWDNQKKAMGVGGAIWIYGKPGKGKTDIAHFLAIQTYLDGLSVTKNGQELIQKVPRPLPHLALSLCRAFQNASLDGFDYYPKERLYIIDDADKFKMSNFREEQLFSFFDRCLKLQRKLIVTSQKNMKEFSEMFSGDFIGAVNRRLAALFTEVEL